MHTRCKLNLYVSILKAGRVIDGNINCHSHIANRSQYFGLRRHYDYLDYVIKTDCRVGKMP